MNQKDKAYAIIGKIVVGIAILFILSPWIIPAIAHAPFKGPTGKIYIRDDENGDHYISLFSDSYQLYLYRYIDPTEEFPLIAGVKTIFDYSGSFYNPLIPPLYTHPEPGILIWKNYAVLKKGEKQRASVTLTVNSNYGVYVSSDAALKGKYYDDITISDDYIVLSGQIFSLPDETNADIANSVISYFDVNAELIPQS